MPEDRADGEPVFRFASFRPPELVAQSTLRSGFASDASRLQTPFRHALRAAAAQPDASAEANKVARDYLRSDDYAGAAAIAAEGPVDYGRLWQAAMEGLEDDDPDAAVVENVTRALGGPAAALVRNDEFVAFEARLWDSLFANCLAGSGRAVDREPLLSAIRLHHLIRALAERDDDGDPLPEPAHAYLRAVPVLPPLVAAGDDDDDDDGGGDGGDREDDSSDGSPKAKPGTKPGKPEPGPEPLPPGLALDDTADGARLAGLLAAADAATTELRTALDAHRRALLRRAGKNREEPPDDEGAAAPAWRAAAGRNGRAACVPADLKPPTTAPFSFSRLPDEAIAGLSAETMGVLAAVGAAPDLQPVPELIEQIESHSRKAVSGYAAGQAAPRAYRIGSVYVPAAPNVAAPPGGLQPVPPKKLPAQGRIRNKGIADLMVVEQRLLRYELGEVAHIENVLASERRKRSHRRLSRTEQEMVRETETTEESERDLQTTDRFEMQRETQSVQQLDASVQAGVTVTGSFGPVETTAYADAALQISRTESRRQATEYARDVTERSVARVMEREFERITRRTLEEIEERNLHGFENVGDAAANITGVYRWVDKVYEAQIVNYGRRLMLELIVPEPAAFYKHAQRYASLPGVTLEPPRIPTIVEPLPGGAYVNRPLRSPGQLTRANYVGPVGQLNVTDVAPPPPEQTIVATTVDQAVSETPVAKASSDLKVPEGYLASTVEYHGWAVMSVGAGEWVYTFVGNFWSGAFDGVTSLNWEDQLVPVGMLALGTPFVMNFELTCTLRPETFTRWQIDTFNTIMEAYRTRQNAYNDQVAAASIRQGVAVVGRNPAKNREIQEQELKRASIRVMSGTDFSEFDAVHPGGAASVYPEFDIAESMAEGRVIQFFEQAFEWEQMTYLFYPYFWGNRATWLEAQQVDDIDPLFGKFLQAGAARVLVPVRPPFNEAVLSYLSHPQPPADPWLGAGAPIIGSNNPLYVSLAEELRAATGGRVDSEPVGDPWTYRVPTSLVYLQADAVLPDYTNGGN